MDRSTIGFTLRRRRWLLAAFLLALVPAQLSAQGVRETATDVAIVAAASFAGALAGWEAAGDDQMELDPTPLSENTLYVEGINLSLTTVALEVADQEHSFVGHLLAAAAGMYVGAALASDVDTDVEQLLVFSLTQGATSVVVSRLWDRIWQ